MTELTVAVIDKEDGYLSLWQDIAQKDERLEVITLQEGAVVNDALERAHGRYFKIAGSSDKPEEDKVILLLDILEESDVDGIITGYAAPDEEKGKKQIVPESASAGRRIDLIKLLDKYKDAKDCLNYHCIIYNTEFLKSTGIELGGVTDFELNEYCIMPFTLLESVMMIPEAVTLICTEGEEEIKPEDTQTVKKIIEHYSDFKPMGKARDEFLRRMISSVVAGTYEQLILKSEDSPKAKHEAVQLKTYIEGKDPALYKMTEKTYKKLVKVSRYKILTRLYGHRHKW